MALLLRRGADPLATDDLFEVVRIETHQEVITDPKTLRPAWARYRRVTRIKAKGEKEHREEERREYAFDWK